MSQEFYVGYQPQAPARLARFLRRLILALWIGALSLAAVLVMAQQPFVAAKFDYARFTPFEGVVEAFPYPVLVSGGRPFLLVAPGKHGLNSLALSDKAVRLNGAVAENGAERMLEAEIGSMRIIDNSIPTSSRPDTSSAVTLAGEIVDSKCYRGVMNPGRGKVHRDCAVRCISGGIPPALLVRDATGVLRTVLLSGVEGQMLGKDLLDVVGEPVRVSGTLVLKGHTAYLLTNRHSISRY